MKVRFGLAAIGAAFVAGSALAGGTLWDNGPLITHPGGGFNGADRSTISPGGTLFGFGAQNAAGNRIADDFTVSGGGWNLTNARFYAYQTGSTTVSTINGLTLRIWDGTPDAGGNIIWGDTVTNVMTATDWTGIYRTTATAPTDTARPIMFVDVDLTGLQLGDGTYYFDWAYTGTLASGPWAPPVSHPDMQIAGNALQSVAGAAFAPAMDAGAGVQQALPFIITGSIVPAPGAIALLGLAGLAARRRRRA